MIASHLPVHMRAVPIPPTDGGIGTREEAVAALGVESGRMTLHRCDPEAVRPSVAKQRNDSIQRVIRPPQCSWSWVPPHLP